jgi:hypothetical protein
MARASPAALRPPRGETTAIRAARSPERARSPRGRRAACLGLLGLLLLDSSLAGARTRSPAAARSDQLRRAGEWTSPRSPRDSGDLGSPHWIEDSPPATTDRGGCPTGAPDRADRGTREQLGRSDLLQLNFLATGSGQARGLRPWRRPSLSHGEAERLDEIRGERSRIETQNRSPGDLPAPSELRLQGPLQRLDGIRRTCAPVASGPRAGRRDRPRQPLETSSAASSGVHGRAPPDALDGRPSGAR